MRAPTGCLRSTDPLQHLETALVNVMRQSLLLLTDVHACVCVCVYALCRASTFPWMTPVCQTLMVEADARNHSATTLCYLM